VRTDGTLWCWGKNTRGQLGIGTRDSTLVPAQVGTATDWDSVVANDSHTCALRGTRPDTTLWCWGDNSEGQLGNGTGWRRDLVQVP
jgi:hypothetical protein